MFSTVASGQARWNQVYQSYIDQYKDMAIEGMLKYGVPASYHVGTRFAREWGRGVEDLFFLVIITLVSNAMVGWVVRFRMMMMQKENVSVRMTVR